MNPTAPNPPAAPAPMPSPASSSGQPPSPPEPYPGYTQEKAALDARVAAFRRAASSPVPGPLRSAFAGEPPTLHGFTLQPVTMALHPLLVKIGSPLLDIARILREEFTRVEAGTAEAKILAGALERIAKEVKTDEEALVETVFAFTRPIEEIRFILSQGRALFREVALREIADRLHPVQFNELQQLVSRHYAASFNTAVSYEPVKGPPDGTVFTKPPAPATASAGGSSCWARLCAIFR